MILYAAHDVVTEKNCPLGYLLLWCICLYIEVDIYASLEVHMSNTIHEGRNVIEMFSVFLKVCLLYYSITVQYHRYKHSNILTEQQILRIRTGTSQNSIWMCTCPTTSKQKEPHVTTTQSQMKRCMDH